MNLDTVPKHPNLETSTSHGYASSESESRKPSVSSGKKRASRAGTRSVTTLSAAQLERKRANDREAQRAIRQRTKDHIENLEKSIGELRSNQESQENVVAATQQRNRELEEENAYLRRKLSEAGYASNVPSVQSTWPSSIARLDAEFHPAQRQQDATLLSINSTSPATQASGSSIPRPSSAATRRSHSGNTPQLATSRHGSFQQSGTYLPGPPGSVMGASSAGSLANTPNLTTWRSHDGGASVHTTSVQAQEAQSHPRSAYTSGSASDRVEWSAVPQSYQFPVNEAQQRSQQYDVSGSAPPPAQQSHQYVQQPVQGYVAPHYHPPQVLPQAEFQNMAVSSPAPYQTSPVAYHVQQPSQQQQSTYQQAQQPQGYHTTPYQMTSMQVPPSGTEYVPAQAHIQPPPLPTTVYHQPQSEGHYAPQAHHPMPHQQEQDARGYAHTHYPPG